MIDEIFQRPDQDPIQDPIQDKSSKQNFTQNTWQIFDEAEKKLIECVEIAMKTSKIFSEEGIASDIDEINSLSSRYIGLLSEIHESLTDQVPLLNKVNLLKALENSSNES